MKLNLTKELAAAIVSAVKELNGAKDLYGFRASAEVYSAGIDCKGNAYPASVGVYLHSDEEWDDESWGDTILDVRSAIANAIADETGCDKYDAMSFVEDCQKLNDGIDEEDYVSWHIVDGAESEVV